MLSNGKTGNTVLQGQYTAGVSTSAEKGVYGQWKSESFAGATTGEPAGDPAWHSSRPTTMAQFALSVV